MNRKEKLFWLTDKQQGLGIPNIVIARFSHCHPSSIANYLNGAEPTVRIGNQIDEGIELILKIVKEKLGEE